MKINYLCWIALAAYSSVCCKSRQGHREKSGLAAAIPSRAPDEVYKAYDITIDFQDPWHHDYGAVIGTSSAARKVAQMTLVDVNGSVLGKAPVTVTNYQLLSFGEGKSYDQKIGIDLFHGKKLGDILGNYYGGVIGLNLCIGGAGGDLAINRSGVVLRNGSFKKLGLLAQIGLQIISIEAVNPEDPFWKTKVEASRNVYFDGEAANRRAWLLDHSVPKDAYRAFVSLSWDPDAHNFFAEAIILDDKMNTVVSKTRLDYDRAKDQFANSGGYVGTAVQLVLLGHENNESCFIRWSGNKDISIVSQCTGWTDFIQSVLGPNKRLSDQPQP